MTQPKFYTAAEVAEILRCTPFTVALACRSGELRATRPHRAWLIEPAAVEEYLAKHENRAATTASPRRRKKRSA